MDVFDATVQKALSNLKRAIVPLVTHPNLDGLLVCHFDTAKRLERVGLPRPYQDPGSWIRDNTTTLDQAPSLAILGFLLSIQAENQMEVDAQATAAFGTNLERLRQRRNVFLLATSWVHQPDVVLGITLGIKATGDSSARTWMVQLLQEGLGRGDVPVLARLIYVYALAHLEQPHRLPQAVFESHEMESCSLPALALMIWLNRREILVPPGPDQIGWLERANSRLIERLVTEGHDEGSDYKAALLWETISAYVESRSHYPRLDVVSTVLSNFSAAMERWREKWPITDEYDVQTLLWLMLRPYFDEVRYEDNLPKLGRSAHRFDIGIPELGLLVEAKYVRKKSDFQKIVEEIAQDSAQLQSQSSFTGIIVFVYDETCAVEQHGWTQQTISGIPSVKRVFVVCAPSVCRPNHPPSPAKDSRKRREPRDTTR